MSKQIISAGTVANDRTGDSLHNSAGKINANFNELYNALGNGSVLSVSSVAKSGNYADLINAPTIPSDVAQLTDHSNLLGGSNGSSLVNGNLSVGLNSSGTLTTPLLLPKAFTAVLDSAHMNPQPGIGFVGAPWQFDIQFQVDQNGTVQTMMNQIFPTLENPGYVSGHSFRFTEADHGIPGYNFDITLNNVVFSGNVHWTANVSVSAPPTYPSTIRSLGAIKLTASTSNYVFGANGKLTLPVGGDIVDSNGNTVLGSSGITLVDDVYKLGTNSGAIYADQSTGRVTIADFLGPQGAPAMPSTAVHIGGSAAFAISRANGSNNPSWFFADSGDFVLPNGGTIKHYNNQSFLGSVSESIVPDADITYDLGSATHRFRDLYLSGNTINLGTTSISSNVSGGVTIDGQVSTWSGKYNVTGLVDFSNNTPIAIGQRYVIPESAAPNGRPGPFINGATASVTYAFGEPPLHYATWNLEYDQNGYLSALTMLTAGSPVELTDQLEISWNPLPNTPVTPFLMMPQSTNAVASTSTLWNDGSKVLTISEDYVGYYISVTGTGWTSDDLIPLSNGSRARMLKLPDGTVCDGSVPGIPAIGVQEDAFGLLLIAPTQEKQITATPDGTQIYQNQGRLTIDGTTGDGYVEINGTASILVGYNSNAQVYLGNPNGGNNVGIFGDFLRIAVPVPTHSIGKPGDEPAMFAVNETGIYHCYHMYDGVTNIWKRITWSNDTW